MDLKYEGVLKDFNL